MVTFLVLFTAILRVGINMTHLLQVRALRLKVQGTFPSSMKVVGWDLNLGLHIRKPRLLATIRDWVFSLCASILPPLSLSLVSSVQNPQILRVCVCFSQSVVVSCYPQGLCPKTPSRCLKLWIVPNPMYTMFFSYMYLLFMSSFWHFWISSIITLGKSFGNISK